MHEGLFWAGGWGLSAGAPLATLVPCFGFGCAYESSILSPDRVRKLCLWEKRRETEACVSAARRLQPHRRPIRPRDRAP